MIRALITQAARALPGTARRLDRRPWYMPDRRHSAITTASRGAVYGALLERGCTPTQVGQALGVDASTVHYAATAAMMRNEGSIVDVLRCWDGVPPEWADLEVACSTG